MPKLLQINRLLEVCLPSQNRMSTRLSWNAKVCKTKMQCFWKLQSVRLKLDHSKTLVYMFWSRLPLDYWSGRHSSLFLDASPPTLHQSSTAFFFKLYPEYYDLYPHIVKQHECRKLQTYWPWSFYLDWVSCSSSIYLAICSTLCQHPCWGFHPHAAWLECKMCGSQVEGALGGWQSAHHLAIQIIIMKIFGPIVSSKTAFKTNCCCLGVVMELSYSCLEVVLQSSC